MQWMLNLIRDSRTTRIREGDGSHEVSMFHLLVFFVKSDLYNRDYALEAFSVDQL